MSVDKYELISGDYFEEFEFISIGKKGEIHKIIQFTPAGYVNVYNLGFGDKDMKTGSISDNVISNNGDSEKVLSTVIEALYLFTDKNQDALVYATGSTTSRTRLYQMGITKFLDQAKKDFIILRTAKKGMVFVSNSYKL